MAKYVSITPCSDWFFVAKNDQVGGGYSARRVAVWAETASGEVIGLVASLPHAERGVPTLIQPAPVGGTYQHYSELSPTLKELLAKGK